MLTRILRRRHSLAGIIACAAALPCSAQSDIKVLNSDAYYPEGPVWYHDKLYYVE